VVHILIGIKIKEHTADLTAHFGYDNSVKPPVAYQPFILLSLAHMTGLSVVFSNDKSVSGQ
jgi:hypothetical protein